MIYILYWTTKKHQKNISRPVHSKLKKIQGLAQKFKDFSRKNGIQGPFKDFPWNSRIQKFPRLCQNPVKGNLVLWTCEIHGAQDIISMKKLRFPSHPRAKERCQCHWVILDYSSIYAVQLHIINNNKYKTDEVTPPHLLSTWLDGSRHSTERLCYLVTHW